VPAAHPRRGDPRRTHATRTDRSDAMTIPQNYLPALIEDPVAAVDDNDPFEVL
jgi:hypothetical protein